MGRVYSVEDYTTTVHLHQSAAVSKNPSRIKTDRYVTIFYKGRVYVSDDITELQAKCFTLHDQRKSQTTDQVGEVVRTEMTNMHKQNCTNSSAHAVVVTTKVMSVPFHQLVSPSVRRSMQLFLENRKKRQRLQRSVDLID